MKKDLDIIKSLIKEMSEELRGDQGKLDLAPPFGKLTRADFLALQAKKKADVEEHHNDPNFPGGPMVHALLDKVAKDWGTDSDVYNYLEDVIVSMSNDTNKGINEEDHEVSMGNNSLDSIIQAASDLKAKLGNEEKDIPAWIQDHITNAENYINQAAKNYHEYNEGETVETDMDELPDGEYEEPAGDAEYAEMNITSIMEDLFEAKKKKPSAGLTKKQKSAVVKKAKSGKDIGKKGKGFEKVAAKAAKEYGSEERGKKVAAAAMWKNAAKKAKK
jgi:hypothetical protein